jgi:hypothetical protein
MRLLKLLTGDKLKITEFSPPNVPSYAILSHTWAHDDEEVILKDVLNDACDQKGGYQKVLFCGRQARSDGLEYFWVDSCCIDKTSSAELSEAINSMFRWYREAKKCYVYLQDVPEGVSTPIDLSIPATWLPSFQRSRWFTRGWTLQELLAPPVVEFFSSGGLLLGNKTSLEQTIQQITGIKIEALRGCNLADFATQELMSWTHNRKTTRDEDMAYSLLGIFGVQMPLIYGEGSRNALDRLHRKIRKRMPSHTAADSRST